MKSSTSFRALTLFSSLVLGTVLPSDAAAIGYRDTSAGGACKPAFGASNKFLFNNTYLENIGTTDQYVVCHFPMEDNFTNPPVAYFLDALFTAGAYDGTAICLAQYAYYGNGGLQLSSSQGSSVTLTAGQYGSVEFDQSLFVRTDERYTLTLNCKVPGSWRMGLIQHWTYN